MLLLVVAWFLPECHALSQEHFSVAPMMAHTNRHYHTYFRFFSEHAHLYTEMIPAETIVNLYNSNKDIESNDALQALLGINSATTTNNGNSGMNKGPIVLQLGGQNPKSLALASELGVRMGYNGINLNCGCPSNAVSGRSGGCALMKKPSHVAECVEQMSESIANAGTNNGNDVELSVKHRLGVRDASAYDAEHDQQQTDDVAYQECEMFIQTITENSNVQKLQVHARLGLLGDFTPDRTEALWTPNSADVRERQVENGTKKIDHKREQYKAKKLARKATMANRSVPPLRPNVVNKLAKNYPYLDFVTNGGIKSMESLRNRVDGTNDVKGAMVGRSVINHPCSFSHVDRLWGGALPQWTREDVIQAHIHYCIQEEERCKDQSIFFREGLRKKLVAVPFSLFAGEDGNNAYQRTIRKLGNRMGRHTADTILQGALTHVSADVRSKSITEFMPLDSIQSYSQYNQRSGPLQRAIL